jgi:hypothetical protein
LAKEKPARAEQEREKPSLMNWTFLGRKIGKASGWDGEIEFIHLYDFKPHSKFRLPPELIGKKIDSIALAITKGFFEFYNSKGKVIGKIDMFEAMADLPKAKDKDNG